MSLESWKKLVESTELRQGINPEKWRPLLDVLRSRDTVWDTAILIGRGSQIMRQKHVDVISEGRFCGSCAHLYEEGEYAYTMISQQADLWMTVLTPNDQCQDCWLHNRRLMDPIDSDQVCRHARPSGAFPDAYGVLQCCFNKEAHPADEHYAGTYVPEGSTERVDVRWPVAVPA